MGLNVSSSHNQKIELIPYTAYTDAKLLGLLDPRATRIGPVRLDAKWILREILFTWILRPIRISARWNPTSRRLRLTSASELSFPEKRPFFLENLAYFETPMKLLFTRRIAEPEFGLGITGKFGGWSVGLLGADGEAAGESG